MFTIATQEAMAASSRVWIYQSNRSFTADETVMLKKAVNEFAQNWRSHGQETVAVGDVLHNQFIVLMADETTVDMGGCSIDSSVQFMKKIEAELSVNLFDRMTFCYQDDNGDVQTASRVDFAKRYADGIINDQTKVFDTLVKTKAELEAGFLKPLADSWHARMV